ncbi:probable ADP-ribosylation factor GTPase-activating protein AGD14 isoform X2 [Abrus precatorius]|uniref:Probable ADP-ribosylation factor GTPase-activating protein AGD14 isoform X2 n=2 Tax=Abrus precatorius TaxID=3816 RepID=A0A8B8LS16_ABRPR|nr:probable ADP-ribosylation factor GTPase-activating protein AGD14 isoform X2 [Abrus precatorius]
MGSRKEEEKNEKIIRGLMKLPPNRRCINCNSLGPQYVCINFWTFICMTCSGIHREFTHRVKSVSMAKFTSQEVDALQNGGNQRAREIYLKDWDFQRQRLPDNSNVEKIREFIRSVYVDRRYFGVKSSEKPPRDSQSPRIHEDEIRRASSYHSYSQSPPYDYQYEDRRYGKQAAALTRKPGSDKVRYEGKMSSIIYSPGRFSDHAYDDRFANEGSGPRISDFSVSSAGDQFKSDVHSPNYHKDSGISSPSNQGSGSSSSEDVWSQARNTSLETNANVNAKRDADGIHPLQRTASTQSTDRKFSSLRSYHSGSLVDFLSEPVQASESLQNKAFGIPRPSGPTRSTSMDLSKAPLESTSSVDLFQLPEAPSQAPLVDLFQSSVLSETPSFNVNQLTQTSQPVSVDLFADLSLQSSTVSSNKSSLELSVSKNEGWATFDMPQGTSSTAQVENPATVTSSAEPSQERFDPFSTSNPNMQWPSFEFSSVSVPSSVTSNLWHDGLGNRKEQGSVSATNSQPWNAFEDSGGDLPVDAHSQELQMHNFPSADNRFWGLREAEGFNKDVVQGTAPIGGFDNHDIPSHVSGSPYPLPPLPPMGDIQQNVVNFKSTNPFDYPYESDVDHNNMFVDMSSLQAALPDALLPATLRGGIAEPWLPQNTVTPYISSAGEGGLSFMAMQSPSSQIQNIQTPEPVASFGGNPFA